MTQLPRALSEQAATVNPSPPAVAFERAAAGEAPARPPVESKLPIPGSVPDQPMQDALKAAAQQIESYLKDSGRELRFSIDDESGRTVVTVRDSVTGDVVRQIPNEEALRLARSLGTQPNALVDISI